MFKKKLFKTQFDNNLTCTNRTVFIRDRIKIVEKYFPELGKAFYDYTDKNAQSRDSIDKISLILSNYGKAEKVTTGFKLQMNEFANILLDVGTEKDSQVQIMETKILEQFTEYDKLCALIRMELKLSLLANERESRCLRQLKRDKENQPQDLQKISLAEVEVLKAKGESVRAVKNLEEHVDVFERRRLNALRESLLAWSLAELQFHSRALQLFTSAYRVVADMDMHSDIEDFRNKLKCTENTPRSDSGFKSNSILQRISHPFQKTSEFTDSGIPHLCSSLNIPHSSFLNNSFQEE